MSGTMTTPPKGQHQYPESETPSRTISNPTDSYNTPARSSQRRQGKNRNNYDQNRQLPYPAGNASDPSLAQGYTSGEQGKPKKANRAHDGSVSDSPAPAVSQKKGRGRQPRQASHGNGSPPKPNGLAPAATPAKDSAYAGPAFHASPAPSALPMPKFFSKSVPANDAPQSLQSRLDQESDSSGASEKSESPPLAEATPAAQILPRKDESPLDLFFRADREEKARKASLLGASTPLGKNPPQVNGRNHSRHESAGTGRGIFNLEMDGHAGITPKPASPSPASSRERIPASRSVTAPSNVSQASQEVEAFPQALKDLFSSSKKLNSQSPVQNNGTTPTHSTFDFHTPSPFYRPSPAPRNVSGGPRTPANQINLEANPYYYGNRNLSPLFQAAKGDSAKRASGLRQELDSSPSVQGRVELPVTHSEPNLTTPSRPSPGRPDASTISRNFLNSHIQQSTVQGPLSCNQYTKASATPPHPGLRSPFTRTASATPSRNGSTPSTDAKIMENDLKRLLKLQLVDT